MPRSSSTRTSTNGAAAILVYSQLAFVPGDGGQTVAAASRGRRSHGRSLLDRTIDREPVDDDKTRGGDQRRGPQHPGRRSNHERIGPLFGLTRSHATALVLIAAIVGILLGLWVAPTLRRETPVIPRPPRLPRPGKRGNRTRKVPRPTRRTSARSVTSASRPPPASCSTSASCTGSKSNRTKGSHRHPPSEGQGRPPPQRFPRFCSAFRDDSVWATHQFKPRSDYGCVWTRL